MPNTIPWEQRKLGEVVNVLDNLRIPIAASQRLEGVTPYYGANGIQGYIDGFTHDGEFVLVAEDGANDLINYPVQYVSGKVWINNHAHVLQGIKNVANNLFLVYRIKSMDMTKYLVGGGRTKLNASVMKDIELHLPNYAEQTQIGNFFKQLDDTIALHQRELEKFKILKTSYLENIFLGKVSLFTAKNTITWEQRKLGELATFSKGCGYSKSDLRDSGYPIILYGRLYTQYETEITEVDTFIENDINAIKSYGNEVIVPASGETSEEITRASAVGKKGIVIGGDLNIIRPKQGISTVFLALSISNGDLQKNLSKKAQGKSVVHIRNDDLKEVILKYPSYEEQTQIGNFFKQLDDTIALHQREVKKYKKIKQSYLEKMFI